MFLLQVNKLINRKESFHNYTSNEYRNNSEHVLIKKLVNILMDISKIIINMSEYVIYKKLKTE